MKTFKTISPILVVTFSALVFLNLSSAAHAEESEIIIYPEGSISNNCEFVRQGYCERVANQALEFVDSFYTEIIDGDIVAHFDQYLHDPESYDMITMPDPANPAQITVQTFSGYDEVYEFLQSQTGFSDSTKQIYRTQHIHVIDRNSAVRIADFDMAFVTLIPLPGIPAGTTGTTHITMSNTLEKIPGLGWRIEATKGHLITNFDL